jgi:hypothetical protein
MDRYITGTDALGLNLNQGIEWWWPAAPSPMVVWFLGSAFFALLSAAIASYALRRVDAPIAAR